MPRANVSSADASGSTGVTTSPSRALEVSVTAAAVLLPPKSSPSTTRDRIRTSMLVRRLVMVRKVDYQLKGHKTAGKNRPDQFLQRGAGDSDCGPGQPRRAAADPRAE